MITLTGMDEGTYYLQEIEAKGYKVDSSVREVKLEWGKTTNIELTNSPLGGLRLKKLDAISKAPVPGTSFLFYDAESKNIIGEYVTDDKGLIELAQAFDCQKLILREIKAAPGYVLDEQPRTVEIKYGVITEIVWENQPQRGQIQITKKAADDNPITKDKDGALLEGAVFDVFDKDMVLVDTIETDSRGMATTKDLPPGTYALREVTAPEFYFTEGKVFYAEIKLHGDVVKFTVLNSSMDISVTVEKRGNVEVIAGDEMHYDFSNISNTSNISLENFYWHDQLPADSVRLKTISTGTWNESLTYSVTYKTNLKSGYRTLASNLTSKQSHTLDCTPAALKLAANEYITDIRFEFGTVKPGFAELDAPSFIVKTLATLPDGRRIVNNTAVSGEVDGKTVTAKDSWVTVALGKPKGCLPKTGFDD